MMLTAIILTQMALSEVDQAAQVAKFLQPNLEERQAQELAQAVVAHAPKAGLHWTKFMAVLFQESSLWLDPTGCLNKKDDCTPDFGVGQVNYRVWGEALDMNRSRMLSQYEYSVRKSAQVFQHYKKRYSKRDPQNWWGFYHSKTPSLKKAYQARVRAVHDKILTRLEVDFNERAELFRSSEQRYCVSGL